MTTIYKSLREEMSRIHEIPFKTSTVPKIARLYINVLLYPEPLKYNFSIELKFDCHRDKVATFSHHLTNVQTFSTSNFNSVTRNNTIDYSHHFIK